MTEWQGFADGFVRTWFPDQRTPRQRWGTCCPFDPECDHSVIDVDELAEWMDTPISDAEANRLAGMDDR